jgi:DNA-binding Lrp family transcriptional regulator
MENECLKRHSETPEASGNANVWDTCLTTPARRFGMGTISDVGGSQGAVKMLLECVGHELYLACTRCTWHAPHAQRERPTQRGLSTGNAIDGVAGRNIRMTAMVTAIVFVKAEVARIPEVAVEIAALNGVSEVYSVTGTIDLIVMIRVASHDQVAEVVADRLNKVPGVVSTETHIAFRAYSAHDLEAAFSLGG